MEWAKQNDVGFLNFFLYFITDGDARATIGRYFIPCDMHLNEEGHHLFAQAFLGEWRVTENLDRLKQGRQEAKRPALEAVPVHRF